MGEAPEDLLELTQDMVDEDAQEQREQEQQQEQAEAEGFELRHTMCGSGDYIAPEVFSGRGYGQQVDIWSAGIVFYILLAGYPPDARAIRRSASALDYPSPFFDGVSAPTKALISRCLSIDPARRPSAHEALAALD